MDDGDLDFSNPETYLCPATGTDPHPPSSCSTDSYFDELLKDTERHACTHTHTCNPPVYHDHSHTHTCVHVHTKIVPASPEASENNNNGSKKQRRPSSSGNRAAVRRYREKKKAHAASLEEEVVRLRALHQQLVEKVQSHAALEAEAARLRCLLVDVKGRIEGEIGAFPYHRPVKNDDVSPLPSVVDQGRFLGGASSCDFRCNDQMHCNPGMQLRAAGENAQCMANAKPGSTLPSAGCLPNVEKD